ncbi:MAG: phosphoribosylglycinamide formyltransferase [Spirochaetaceae bacterium]
MYRIAVLVSGSGSNLQALIDATRDGRLHARVELVLSDRPGVFALERARRAGITTAVVPRGRYRGRALSDRILEVLCATAGGVDLIVLAGFLSILEGPVLEEYAGRILNIHPGPLPAFGGRGMYGIHVHRAVLEAGARESACTVHVVDEGTDTGPVLLERRVPVEPDDTPERLSEKVRAVEHPTLVDGVRLLATRLGLSEEAPA